MFSGEFGLPIFWEVDTACGEDYHSVYLRAQRLAAYRLYGSQFRVARGPVGSAGIFVGSAYTNRMGGPLVHLPAPDLNGSSLRWCNATGIYWNLFCDTALTPGIFVIRGPAEVAGVSTGARDPSRSAGTYDIHLDIGIRQLSRQ